MDEAVGRRFDTFEGLQDSELVQHMVDDCAHSGTGVNVVWRGRSYAATVQ